MTRLARSADHYGVLGVTTDASLREIQQAYWRRAFGGLGSADREALNAAYDVLGNERRRREYDDLRLETAFDELVSERVPSPAPSADPGLRGRLGWPSI